MGPANNNPRHLVSGVCLPEALTRLCSETHLHLQHFFYSKCILIVLLVIAGTIVSLFPQTCLQQGLSRHGSSPSHAEEGLSCFCSTIPLPLWGTQILGRGKGQAKDGEGGKDKV